MRIMDSSHDPKHAAMKMLLYVLGLVSMLCVPSMAGAIVNPEGLSEQLIRNKQTGDYDVMVRERVIRVLVPYSKTFYFLDQGKQRGLTYEALKQFEAFVNKREKTKTLKINILFITTSRDKLLADLQEGVGDIAAGNLTITKERSKLVDFANPFAGNIDEIVVTATGEPALKNLFDLSGREVYVRKSSSYYESLLKLNKGLHEMGKEEVKLIPVDEYLEDEDLLEMVNVGVIPTLIVDSHKAQFWAQIFEKIILYPDIKVNTGGEIAWAIRKNSPKLKQVINEFVKTAKQGTLLGNILIKRYLKNTKYITNNLSDKEMEKFNKVVDLFREYGDKYQFDWLMLGALAYQESQLDHSKKSGAGAIGIMQVLPSTAKDSNVGISDIEKLENNIHAGTKYLRFMVDRYYSEEEMDDLNKGLFAFASYNAGPAKISRIRRQAAKEGLDPNVWFNSVELVAAKRIGRETVQYVSNIYKYYIAYKIIVNKKKLKDVKKALQEEQQR